MVKLIEKNKQLIYLVILVALLLVISCVSNKEAKDINIQIFGTDINNINNNSAYVEKGEIYISLDSVKKYIDKDIFYDKISNYLIITHDRQILKFKVGVKEASLNFKKINLVKVIQKKNSKIYIPISAIKNIYEIVGISNKYNDVYIAMNNIQEVSFKNNNASVYERTNINSKVVGTTEINDKNNKATILYSLDNTRWLLVKTEKGIAGYIQKYNLSKESTDKLLYNRKYLKEIEDKKIELSIPKKMNGIVYIDSQEVSNIYKQNNINNIFIDMFEILKINGEVNISGANSKWVLAAKNSGYRVYGNINNGYTSSNFDNTVISTIIKSEDKRETLIVNILNNVIKYNLDGIVIDFKNIKQSDSELYVQFLKELSTAMKSSSKKLILKSDLNNNSLNIYNALDYLDYYILKGYNHRELDSNISGTDSDINKIKTDIEETTKINKGKYMSKVILELPSFSILWEEKNSKVINSSIYSQQAVSSYILKNKLTKKIDNKTNQNYLEMTKGIINYKMWVEDEYSIKAKIKIAKDKGLAGIIIYRSGYDTSSFISKIFK